MVQGIIAGGPPALVRSVEHAEDDGNAGIQALQHIGFSAKDVLVGITASGSAPFVVEAMRYARDMGAVVGAISCNAESCRFPLRSM
jgi:N-acetylmuramic acid 6-phosphate etherase